MLIREIAAGRLVDGEKLPPERDMAEDLGIAVGTLRKALAELQRKGLLKRVQGSGNYVSARADVDSVYAMFRLELIEGGGLPTARVLSVARMAKPADLPSFGSSGEAHRIRRLRLLGGKPAALEEIWLDGSRARERSAPKTSRTRSISIIAARSASGLQGPRIASASPTSPTGHQPPSVSRRERPSVSSSASAGRRTAQASNSRAAGSITKWRATSPGCDRGTHGQARFLRHHRLRHDGPGASPQHRADARGAKSPRSTSRMPACGRPLPAWRLRRQWSAR